LHSSNIGLKHRELPCGCSTLDAIRHTGSREADYDCHPVSGHFFGRDFLRQYQNCTVPGTDLEIECHWTEQGTRLQDGNITSHADTADVLA
jgi:hypothetical protein